MCRLTAPKLQNVVVHTNLKKKWRINLGRDAYHIPEIVSSIVKAPNRRNRRSPSNLYVVVIGGATVTVFPRSRDLIVTGFKSFSKKGFKRIAREFTEKFRIGKSGRKSLVRNRSIVNSTHIGKIQYCWTDGGHKRSELSVCKALFDYKCHLSLLPADHEEKKRVSVCFRSQFFPGAKIKLRDHGTANVFNNGNYCLVGCKNQKSSAQRHNLKIGW